MEIYRSLPAANLDDLKDHWIVHLHIYEKEDHKPRVHIDSGASSELGGGQRLKDYDETKPSLG